ncbi:MAG: transposase, partial [Bacillota bacterium]|nr:transposase [Bacillota bacterium]
MNGLFKYMYKNEQDFIIRLTSKRKLFNKGKWYKATTLCDSRKGKIKTKVLFSGEEKECYISHLNVQITASKKNMCLVLVYGLGERPMMLATNKKISGKEDVINILRLYLSRWRIEEYFRFKKQAYNFENFRVRNLKAINNLNQLLTYALGFV